MRRIDITKREREGERQGAEETYVDCVCVCVRVGESKIMYICVCYGSTDILNLSVYICICIEEILLGYFCDHLMKSCESAFSLIFLMGNFTK